MKLRKYVPEFIVLVYAILFLLTKNPSNEWDRIIVSDGKGYYAYLTAFFIYHDTDFGYIDKYESQYYPASQQLYKDFRYQTDDGIVNKYFPGTALLWLPFFGTGHAMAYILDLPADGYSMPYQLTIAFAAFFYFWLALLILRKILRFYTSNENAIAWSLAAVAMATNLIYYTVNAGCQVHVYNFFLINAFVFAILSAIRNGKLKYYIAAAFLLGMILISRPQNGLIILAIPFLCGSWDSFQHFLKKIFTDIRFLSLSFLALALPLLVPVAYWYSKTGHFLVYSYGNESYDLTKPHLLSFLFSFEKGWMLYTPVAVFAASGILFLFRKSKWQFFSLSAFLLFVVYFLSSWWVWTYTSYISQRVMIDYYVFIAILLIFIFSRFPKKGSNLFIPLIISGFIALNVMQHFQQLNWVYPAGPVTAKSYFSNFFSFSKGTTFMIPDNEISGKQLYINDFETNISLFINSGYHFSSNCHAGKSSLVLDSLSDGKPLFMRGMTDYRAISPVILKISGWYLTETVDSVLTVEVEVGNLRKKYSTMHHDLMPGLKPGKWTYAEMAVYLPYLRSASDSLFISLQNFSKSKVLLDDLHVEFLKMKGPERHDWILPADDQVDSEIKFQTDFETPLVAPFGNPASVSASNSFSGKNASCIQLSSPYSVVFEIQTDTLAGSDGYVRVSSRISGIGNSDVILVFDFTSGGKTIYYKTYPVKINGPNNSWTISEIFREFPAARLKADKVKIYYWYTKGTKPVYIDDLQVDIVKYKPVKTIKFKSLDGSQNAQNLLTSCCDFESVCQPESGNIIETPFATSGKRTCLIKNKFPFSFSHLLPLNGMLTEKNNFVNITAKVNSDQYITGANLIADFRHNGKTIEYKPFYLRGQTAKGEWNAIDFSLTVPPTITSKDSVLVYFYLSDSDEELMIDDFCVSLKQTNPKLLK